MSRIPVPNGATRHLSPSPTSSPTPMSSSANNTPANAAADTRRKQNRRDEVSKLVLLAPLSLPPYLYLQQSNFVGLLQCLLSEVPTDTHGSHDLCKLDTPHACTPPQLSPPTPSPYSPSRQASPLRSLPAWNDFGVLGFTSPWFPAIDPQSYLTRVSRVSEICRAALLSSALHARNGHPCCMRSKLACIAHRTGLTHNAHVGSRSPRATPRLSLLLLAFRKLALALAGWAGGLGH